MAIHTASESQGAWQCRTATRVHIVAKYTKFCVSWIKSNRPLFQNRVPATFKAVHQRDIAAFNSQPVTNIVWWRTNQKRVTAKMAEAVCWNDETTPMRRESSHSDFVSSRVIDSPADMMIIYFELRLINLHIQDLHFGLTDTDIT